MRSSRVSKPPRGEMLGKGQAILNLYARQGVVTLCEWVSSVNRMQLTPSGCRFIVHDTPEGPTCRGLSLIWEIQG